MTEKISIVESKGSGLVMVKHDGYTLASLFYCREEYKDERCYPTRARALELAKIIARHLVPTNPVMTERGIDFCPMSCTFKSE